MVMELVMMLTNVQQPQGVVVDVNGCADSDNDGVFDYVDLCPNTFDNSIVDNDGCADYQRDTDGDGVNDDFDQCSNTPQGERRCLWLYNFTFTL